MTTPARELYHALHRKGLATFFAAGALVAVFFALMAASLASWHAGWWPVTVLCILLQAHVGHANLLAFHEASHYTLHPRRWVNEAMGILVGTFILTPLSAYRLVHNRHHAHLTTENDTELWPFTDPAVPRWRRRLAAAGELLVGFFYTPVIFLRGVVVEWPDMAQALRRRMVAEYALGVALWAAALAAVALTGAWGVFLLGYLVPSIVSGNLQSLRKFTEHLGLHGDDVPTTTRTVADDTALGRLLSWTMLHIDLHGPHHRHPKIPQYNLPAALPVVYAEELREPGRANVYPSYAAAVWAMARTLGDPRVGSQWVPSASGGRRPPDATTSEAA